MPESKTYKANKKKKIREMKERRKSRGCDVCKNRDNTTFHHVDSTKKQFDLGGAGCKTITQVQAELDKCIVLCETCHTRLHNGDKAILDKLARPW